MVVTDRFSQRHSDEPGATKIVCPRCLHGATLPFVLRVGVALRCRECGHRHVYSNKDRDAEAAAFLGLSRAEYFRWTQRLKAER
jgi:DNA-directed RNA polymerase subunit RPC12/RpoP